MSSPLGTRSRPTTSGIVSGVRQAVEELRHPAQKRTGTRPDRGDVRGTVLTLLAEQPMHGYQIVRALEERSPGGRTPAAGSVYPVLQLLADEGLATADDSTGRKIYTLTGAGRIAAQAAAKRGIPPETPEVGVAARSGAIPKAAAQLAIAAGLVSRNRTPGQIADAAAVLDEARRKLYSILARN